MRAKITATGIETAKSTAIANQKELYVWDTELKGFGCRVSPSGQISWVIQRWYGGRGGKSFRYVLEQSPVLNLQDARTQALIHLAETHKGTNLVLRRKQARAQLNQSLQHSLGAVFKLYDSQQGRETDYWKQTRNRFNNVILPTLGASTPVKSVSKQDLRKLKLSDHNLFASLSGFFRWCLEHDYVAVSPMASLSAPKPSNARERVLTKGELKAIWQASNELGYPFGPIYQLLILTAQRLDEVASLEWSEIEGNTWTIPKHKSKNGKAHIVHLSALALELLAKVPRKKSRYVFTRTLCTPVSGFSKAKLELDKLTEITEPYVIHDIRRTVTSKLAELGVLTDVADRILNHVSGSRSGVKGIYQRYEFLTERKEALLLWSKFVSRL